MTYPVIDGVVDFCPQAQDRIAASYDKVAPRYNPTASTRENIARQFEGFTMNRQGNDRSIAWFEAAKL